MTLTEIRLACLKLARPDAMSNVHDAALIVARAKAFEEYVGVPEAPAQNTLSLPAAGGDRAKPKT